MCKIDFNLFISFEMVLHCEKVCLKMALVHGYNKDNSAIVAIAFLLLRAIDLFQSDEW